MTMKATYVAAVRTPAEPAAVSAAYRAALTELTGAAPSPRAVAVLHAQCALETGNMASCWNYGVGNVKAGTLYEGLYTCIRLNERLKQPDGSYAYVWFRPQGEERNGVVVGPTYTVPEGHPQTRMRAFNSLSDGVFDKIRFLSQPHWKPALDIALRGDANGYVHTVRSLGYFTAPVEPYARAVVSLFAKFLPIAEGSADDPGSIEDRTCRDMADCMRVEIPDWLRARVQAQSALLGVDWDEQQAARDDYVRKDSDPTLPGAKLPDTEPPKE
jgi:hypothetical protein